MSFRRVLSIIYAMHAARMDDEQLAQFDAALNASPRQTNTTPDRSNALFQPVEVKSA